MTTKLRSSATTDELIERLGINAQVQSDSAGNYSVAYGEIHYATTTQRPENLAWAAEFGKFADWASRLNIAQQRGMPPFGRMRMNSQIAADGRIPQETRLLYRQGQQTQSYRSTHEVAGHISLNGQRQIDQLNDLIALSKEVPLTEFPK
jgi:hypothetical protein